MTVLDAAHIISAADEKILRSFEAPLTFCQRLQECVVDDDSAVLLNAVVVPALGLSNRTGNETVSFEAPFDQPPTEYDLSRLTLWIETDKLYGHGQELYALAVTHCGQLAVSASKAITRDDATIRFWRRNSANNTWSLLPTVINAHNLTIIKLTFSPDDRFLLGVSRDRHLSLISVDKDGEKFELLTLKEAHARIIWSADWSPSGDYFVTVLVINLSKLGVSVNKAV